MKEYIKYTFAFLTILMLAQINCFAQPDDKNQGTIEISKEDDIRLFTSKNKVWETVRVINDEVSKIFYQAFRGTAEFNGKTYNRLCYIAEANGEFAYEYPDNDECGKKSKIIIKDLVIYDEPSEEFFLRQEGSKVYMLDEKTDLLESFPKESFPMYYYFEGDEHEMQIFDFNFKEEDSWDVVYNRDPGIITTIKVNELSIELVDGVQCMKMKCLTNSHFMDYYAEETYGYPVVIIEGLGIVSNVGMDAGSFFLFPLDPPKAASQFYYSFLNNIYDLNGNVLNAGYEVTTSSVDRIYPFYEIKLYHKNGGVYAESDGDKEISLSVYSTDGSVVASATGTGNIEYPLSQLQKGVYIVRAVAGDSVGKTIRVAI